MSIFQNILWVCWNLGSRPYKGFQLLCFCWLISKYPKGKAEYPCFTDVAEHAQWSPGSINSTAANTCSYLCVLLLPLNYLQSTAVHPCAATPVEPPAGRCCSPLQSWWEQEHQACCWDPPTATHFLVLLSIMWLIPLEVTPYGHPLWLSTCVAAHSSLLTHAWLRQTCGGLSLVTCILALTHVPPYLQPALNSRMIYILCNFSTIP
jgi:hypothetical protein